MIVFTQKQMQEIDFFLNIHVCFVLYIRIQQMYIHVSYFKFNSCSYTRLNPKWQLFINTSVLFVTFVVIFFVYLRHIGSI
jgi:hypothetical protein